MTSPDGDGFRIVEERTVWEGRRLLRVVEATVAAPDGELLDREVLHHPGAVAALPLHDDGTVTLVRQYRVATDQDMWEIPAGLRDVEGEPLAETARRELVEEAGLKADHVDPLITFHNSPGCSDETVAVFVATGLSEVPDDRQGAEEAYMRVDRVTLAAALAMVDDGRITDSKTVISLLLAARRG